MVLPHAVTSFDECNRLSTTATQRQRNGEILATTHAALLTATVWEVTYCGTAEHRPVLRLVGYYLSCDAAHLDIEYTYLSACVCWTSVTRACTAVPSLYIGSPAVQRVQACVAYLFTCSGLCIGTSAIVHVLSICASDLQFYVYCALVQ